MLCRTSESRELTYGFGFEGLRQRIHWDDLSYSAYPPTRLQSRYSYTGEKRKVTDAELVSFLTGNKRVVLVHFGPGVTATMAETKLITEVISKVAEDVAFVIEENLFDSSDADKLRQMPNVLMKEKLPVLELLENESIVLRLARGDPNTLMETLYHGVPQLIFA